VRYFIFAAVLTVLVLAVSAAGTELQSHGGLAATVGLIDTSSWQATSSPQASSTVQSAGLTDVISQLQDEIKSLNKGMLDLRYQVEANSLKIKFPRTLKKGDSGKDVSTLQEALAKFPDLYPPGTAVTSTISGFYGNLTKEAVAQLQSNSGLPQTGIFDSDTLKNLLSYKAGGNGTVAGVAPVDISSVISLENQITQIQADLADTRSAVADLQGQVSDLQSEVDNLPSAPIVSSPPPAAPSVSISISNLQAASVTNNSAVITWTTNLNTKSEVDYSINSTLSTQVTITSSSTMASSHSITLKSLSSNTKYYYRAISADNSGNSAQSSIQFFTTTH
jgi:TolA-binding protein